MISIIIPIYNAQKYIDKCMESVIEQTYSDIEILLINDGSTDSSLDICKKWSEYDARIRVYDQPNVGVSGARNKGLDVAKGEYVTFIDIDDKVEKEYIQKLHKGFIDNNSDFCVAGFNKIFLRHIEKFQLNSITIDIMDKPEKIACIINEEIFREPWNKLYDKKIIDKNNIRFSLNVPYGEDTVFVLQYLCKCKKITVIDDLLYNYNCKRLLGGSTRFYSQIYIYLKKILMEYICFFQYIDIEEFARKNIIEQIAEDYIIFSLLHFTQAGNSKDIITKSMIDCVWREFEQYCNMEKLAKRVKQSSIIDTYSENIEAGDLETLYLSLIKIRRKYLVRKKYENIARKVIAFFADR